MLGCTAKCNQTARTESILKMGNNAIKRDNEEKDKRIHNLETIIYVLATAIGIITMLPLCKYCWKRPGSESDITVAMIDPNAEDEGFINPIYETESGFA